MGNLQKNRLVEFIAKIMEESGFKVYKDFRTSRHLIDIYGILPTVLGDFGVVVSCKNYDEKWNVGLDVLKEMEMVAKTLKASKVVIVTTSGYSSQAVNYAARRNIKLIDREGLLKLAQKFSKRSPEMMVEEEEYGEEEYEGAEISYNPPESRSSFFHSDSKGSLNRKRDQLKTDWWPIIQGILSNTVILILMVIGLSYLLANLIGYFITVNSSTLGIIKILLSVVLSYGLVFLLDRKGALVLVKGTTVFFVSLLALIIQIIFL
ncbi:MAG: restriction endonuclease [Methanobacterium sp.]|nr:MAG: restriction endonuclease [Methanobacterium sp.]